jgi:hypothetical protein
VGPTCDRTFFANPARAGKKRPTAGRTHKTPAPTLVEYLAKNDGNSNFTTTTLAVDLTNSKPPALMRDSVGAARRIGQVAQLVEQGTENPRVGGSIPSLATTPFSRLLP